jgi:hypothetical protein
MSLAFVGLYTASIKGALMSKRGFNFSVAYICFVSSRVMNSFSFSGHPLSDQMKHLRIISTVMALVAFSLVLCAGVLYFRSLSNEHNDTPNSDTSPAVNNITSILYWRRLLFPLSSAYAASFLALLVVYSLVLPMNVYAVCGALWMNAAAMFLMELLVTLESKLELNECKVGIIFSLICIVF